MKNFNPDRELNKIKYRKRNKVVLLCFLMIVVSIIGYSFALYQVRHNKRIIYTTVDDFINNKDIILTVLVDGKKEDKMPSKEENVYYDGVDCDNDDNVSARWDYANWRLTELNVTVPNKCNINFTKNYRDDSGANPPELYQGLIPITIDENGEIYVANLTSNWYDYDAHEWANAVLIDDKTNHNKYYNADGTYKSDTNIPMEDILQMYVWIPRYKYALFNAISGQSRGSQEIIVEFEINDLNTGKVSCEISNNGKETCKNALNGNWYTHPAFTFGNTELKGIWVGKFESSGTVNDLTILPEKTPLVNQTLSVLFNATRDIDLTYSDNYNLNSKEIDIHMAKNIEWGAMAYLTQSRYGRCTDGTCVEITINSTNKTGYASQAWNTDNGKLASTTGNMYGIYDTAGGYWEFVMGIMMDSSGTDISYPGSGFSKGDLDQKERYYDKYEYDYNGIYTHLRGHLGDATRETLESYGAYSGAWYGEFSLFTDGSRSWPLHQRSGSYADGTKSGIFAFYSGDSTMSNNNAMTTFRVVLTAEDSIQ